MCVLVCFDKKTFSNVIRCRFYGGAATEMMTMTLLV